MPLNLSDPRVYTVRPFSKPARTDLKDVFRVYLSPSILLSHKLRSGDLCMLQVRGGEASLIDKQIPALAWSATEKIQDTVVQTSKPLQELHELKLGDKVSLRAINETILESQSIVLSEIPSNASENSSIFLDNSEKQYWAWFLDHPLQKAEVLSPGMLFEDVELKGQKRSFRIEQINSSDSRSALYQYQPLVLIRLQDAASVRGSVSTIAQRSIGISRDGIGGLARQLDQLDQRLEAYIDTLYRIKLPAYYRSRRGGMLLYGPSGTGKSLILKKLSKARWASVFNIDVHTINKYGGNANIAVSRIFADARRSQPCAIIVDRLETLAAKNRDHDMTRANDITASLCEEFDRLGDSKILVVAATKSLNDIAEGLRQPGRFGFQLEIPIPDSKTRAEILKILSAESRDANVPALEDLGDRTHGFVGADLNELVQLAVDKAKSRILATYDVNNTNDNQSINSNWSMRDDQQTLFEYSTEIVVEVTESDLNEALLEIRPTAMQEVFLETPRVRWSDIGGQHEIKHTLKQAVEWPFKYPTELTRLGLHPKKGLLMYGPPGCSKTLTAQAVATEAGLNFLAVKGAELLSMYVGESERAMREVFRKARAAAPSIIFFDEIDAIGSSRDSGSGGGSSNGGLNVLTTLLNELDGIEVLKGVFVLAATNKPEVLDPALMRPGRLDTCLYVGLPDLEARREILAIQIGKMDLGLNVDVAALAERLEGYSGAEMMSVCQRAGYAALEEQVETGLRMQVLARHFELGLGQVKRGITAQMRARYEEWGERASSG